MRLTSFIRRAAGRLKPAPEAPKLAFTPALTAALRDEWDRQLMANSVERSVIVAGTFRAGTTYFASLLRPIIRNDAISKELFAPLDSIATLPAHQGEAFIRSQFAAVAGRAGDGLFASKLQWPHRNNLARCLGIDRKRASEFGEVFPNATWFWVRRSDKFAQAVSFWRAKTTSQWHRFAKDKVPEAPPFSFSGIDACYRELAAHDDLWADFFERSGIVPVEILYEDLVSDPSSYLGARLPAPLLEGAVIPGAVRLIRQADAVSAKYRSRYIEQLYRLGA